MVEAISKGISIKRRRGSDEQDPFAGYQVFDGSGLIVMNEKSLRANEKIFFKVPQRIIAESACNWKTEKLNQLNIVPMTCSDLSDFMYHLGRVAVVDPSDRANSLLAETVELSAITLSSYREKDFDENTTQFHSPIWKAIFLLKRFTNHESIVDIFVYILLEKMGFCSGLIFPFPQLRMDLHFGNEKREASPDFTVMDLVRNFYMSVVEDKSEEHATTDSLAQLVAEAIAMWSANNKSHGIASASTGSVADSTKSAGDGDASASAPPDLPPIGLRVNGSLFQFYVIPVTESIIRAMETLQAAQTPSLIYSSEKFDFLIPAQRQQIVLYLDNILSCIQDHLQTAQLRV